MQIPTTYVGLQCMQNPLEWILSEFECILNELSGYGEF